MRYLSGALLLYGVVGVAVLLRLPALLWEGARGWFGLRPSTDPPAPLPWLDLFHSHFDARPWLPWATWLVGIGILTWLYRPQPALPDDTTLTRHLSPVSRHARWLSLTLLLALLLVAGYARLSTLVPPGVGISQLPYDDEGVNAGASQLFIQGVMPYSDYFFAHPPFAALTYAPAMLYRFNEWGSPTSFMNARYLSVAYGLLTIFPLFYIGSRLAGLWGGTIASLLWALDGRVVEINRKVMLDTPMVLFACAALALYLWARAEIEDQGSGIKGRWAMAGVGALGALAALTKITGVACLIAILADLIWLNIEGRGASRNTVGASPSSVVRRPLSALWLLGGAFVTVLLVAGPFLLMAPSEITRQVLFFQLLRPSDGLADVPARVNDLAATLANALTPLFAALGFLLMTIRIWLHRNSNTDTIPPSAFHLPPSMRPLVLWASFTFLLFTYSRSFYPHYYIQIAAPLCLLGAGVGLLGPALSTAYHLLRNNRSHSADSTQYVVRGTRYAASSAAILLTITLPLLATVWGGLVTRREDRIFEIVARYMNNAVSPNTEVLTTDEQFNLLAARPPSRNATGYLVDSYGHMIYLGMNMPTRDWGDLLGGLLGGPRSNDAYAALHRPAPQADLLDRASRAPLIVIHDRGLARLTDPTLAQIKQLAQQEVEEARYTIYRQR